MFYSTWGEWEHVHSFILPCPILCPNEEKKIESFSFIFCSSATIGESSPSMTLKGFLSSFSFHSVWSISVESMGNQFEHFHQILPTFLQKLHPQSRKAARLTSLFVRSPDGFVETKIKYVHIKQMNTKQKTQFQNQQRGRMVHPPLKDQIAAVLIFLLKKTNFMTAPVIIRRHASGRKSSVPRRSFTGLQWIWSSFDWVSTYFCRIW